MSNGWDGFLNWLGYSICHQLPERTIHFGNNALFVCARDTGLYAGFFLVLIAIALPWRRKQGASLAPLAGVHAPGLPLLRYRRRFFHPGLAGEQQRHPLHQRPFYGAAAACWCVPLPTAWSGTPRGRSACSATTPNLTC